MLPILNQSFWRDEAFSVLMSMHSLVDIVRLTVQDASPPLSYFVLHFWMLLFGTSEVSTRGLSFLFHVLTVGVVVLITRRFTHSVAARILIPLCVLLNPFLLQYSFEARGYSLLAFLTVLGVYLAMRKKLVLASIAFALGIVTHNFGIFSFIGFSLWFWFTSGVPRTLINMLSIGLAPVLALASWFGVLWSQWTHVASGFWIETPASTIFLKSLEKFSLGDITYPTQDMLFVFSLLLVFFGFSYWLLKDRKEDHFAFLLLFAGLVPVFISYVVSALFVPIYHERYLIATAPILIVLIGYSLTRLLEERSHLKTVLLIVLVGYILLLVQSAEYLVRKSTKPAINWAVEQSLLKAQPGDIVVPKDALNFLEVKYYTQQSGKDIKAYAYVPKDKEIPFYIGKVLFEDSDIITELPSNARVWIINPDGGYELLGSK